VKSEQETREQGRIVMSDVVLAWSGGKDSTLALAALRADPRYRVAALLTTVTREYDRISMHGVRRSVLDAQVRALGLPLLEVSIPAVATNDEYQAAFALALQTAQELWPGLRHIACGDLFLREVRAYREAMLSSLGYEGLFPLWGEDTAALARRFVSADYRAIVTCVDTTQLGAEFAGREFDSSFLADLPAAVDPCGERGEFHTCVYAGPLFTAPLPLVAGNRVRREGRFEYCDVELGPTTGRLTARPRRSDPVSKLPEGSAPAQTASGG
jgi:uncharacterized protein (TIGR00290 family)